MIAMSESGLRRKNRSETRGEGRGEDRGTSRRSSGGEAGDVLRDVREKAAGVAERVIGGTREVKEQVMQKASELTRAVTDGVKEEAERFFDEQKGKLGSKVQRVSKVINQAAHALKAVKADAVAEAVDAAAERVEQASSYIEKRNLGDLMSDAEDIARRHPGLMLGGLFVVGLAAARFAKASATPQESPGGAGASTSRAGKRRRPSQAGRNGRVAHRR